MRHLTRFLICLMLVTAFGLGTVAVQADIIKETILTLAVTKLLDFDADTAAEVVTIDSTNVATTTGLVTITDLRATTNNDTLAEATLRIASTGTFAVDIDNGAFSSAEALQTETNVGAAGSSGTATEYGDGYHHTTVITGLDISGGITSAGSETITGVAYTFPECAIVIHSCVWDGKVYAATATDTAEEFAIGTAAGSGALTTTEQDILVVGVLDGAITTTPGVTHQDTTLSSLNGAGVTPAWYDGTGAAITANVSIYDSSWNNGPETLYITGTLTIVWSFVGDF